MTNNPDQEYAKAVIEKMADAMGYVADYDTTQEAYATAALKAFLTEEPSMSMCRAGVDMRLKGHAGVLTTYQAMNASLLETIEEMTDVG